MIIRAIIPHFRGSIGQAQRNRAKFPRRSYRSLCRRVSFLGEKSVSQANVANGQWYLSQNEKRFGPLTSQVLRQLAGAGRIGSDAWLLQAGTDVWVRARPSWESCPRRNRPTPRKRLPCRVPPLWQPPRNRGSPIHPPPRPASCSPGPTVLRAASAAEFPNRSPCRSIAALIVASSSGPF